MDCKSCEPSSSTSASGPNILTANWALVPVRSSSTDMAMGWPILTRIPGKLSRSSDIDARRSSGVRPARHSDRGFRATKASILLTGSAWAPTSPRPMRLTIESISGKRSKRRRSSRVEVSRPSVSDMDGAIETRRRISPSSSAGVNSEPSREPARPPTKSRPSASATAASRTRTKDAARGLTSSAILPSPDAAFFRGLISP